MLLRKIFKNLHAVVAILVLYFEKISCKLCFKFLTPILSASSNMMHFQGQINVSTVTKVSSALLRTANPG